MVKIQGDKKKCLFQEKQNKKREVTLDAIRVFALLSVISVHFFRNSGYYNTLVKGKRMFVMTMIREFFLICVPLFIILTGYLMCYKKLNQKYFGGIKKTIYTYIFSSIICILFINIFRNGSYGLKESILGILDFTAAGYAWYIEMYIGLFLFIPFLNIMYHV